MRDQNTINNEYGQTAAQLGQEEYLKSLAEEQVEKHNYNAMKLKNKMQSLAKEAAALKDQKPEEVPVEQA